MSKHFFVIKTDNVAFRERKSVYFRTSYRVSYLTGRNVVYRVQHIYKVFVGRRFGVERKRGGNPLRNTLRRYNVDFLALYERFRLFGGENYILIIGKYEYIFGVNLYNRVRDVLRRRVHGLPALDYPVAIEIFEYIGKPRTRTNRKHAHFFLFRFVLFDKFAVFFEHVFDFDSVYFAELKSLTESLVGIIRMNVDFYEFEIAYDEHAIAYGH